MKSNLTFLISFRIENFISSDRKNIISNYKILQQKVTNETQEQFKTSFMANMEPITEINQNYFEQIKNTSNNKSNPNVPISPADNNEMYYPRIFSIATSNATLELLVGIHNRKRRLILEVFIINLVEVCKLCK